LIRTAFLPDDDVDGHLMAQEIDVSTALSAAVEALGGEHRAGQVQMAAAVAEAFASGEHVLIQAGTGTGKSLGYLVPSILHAMQGAKAGRPARVVVATATLALQHQLVERDLPRLADALEPLMGRRPTFAVHKGRHNYVCLDKVSRKAPEEDEEALFATPTSILGKQAARVHEWIQSTDSGDRDDYPGELDPRVWRSVSVQPRECVGANSCAFGAECFVEAAREEARDVDVIVTNHAMLAIHVLEQPLLPEHDVVVVDEAHEMADRFTGTATDELSVSDVHRAASRARREVEPAFIERLEDAAALLESEIQALMDGRSGTVRIESVQGSLLLALAGVRDASHAAVTAMNANKDRSEDPDTVSARHRAKAAADQVHDVAGKLLSLTQHDVAWIETSDRRAPVIRVAPLNIAGLLRESLFAKSTVVLTSATLTLGGSFEPLAAQVGLPVGAKDRTWRGIDVGSPFDHAKQGILYCPRHVPAPGREGVSEAALDELADLLIAAGGRTLALFSSWRGVERASEHLTARLIDAGRAADLPMLVQRRGDRVGDLISRFAADPRTSLLGTLSLWQGVDVPGHSCTLVAIDRIPFPRPDEPLVAARSRKADESGGSGFAQVSVPRAALLLAQGVGRLVRGVDDRGVVAVLDSRLANAGYGPFLRASLPPFWWTTDGQQVRESLARLDEAADASED
jgi:ATP-dependent DNA helicase DinG